MKQSDERVWHLSREGNQYGPFSYQELLQQVQHGEVQPTDLLWTAGFAEWMTASSMPGLLAPPALGSNPTTSLKAAPPPQNGGSSSQVHSQRRGWDPLSTTKLAAMFAVVAVLFWGVRKAEQPGMEEVGQAVTVVAGAIVMFGFIIPYCVTEWRKDRRERRRLAETEKRSKPG